MPSPLRVFGAWYKNRDGIDLNERPVLKALVTGIEELYKLGKEFRYEDLREGYASICHLCLDIRKHLFSSCIANTDIDRGPKQEESAYVLAQVRQLKVFSFFFKKIWLIRINQKRFGEHYLLKRFVV